MLYSLTPLARRYSHGIHPGIFDPGIAGAIWRSPGGADPGRAMHACGRLPLRVNTLKAAPEDIQARLTQAGLAWEAVPWSPEALILPHCREDVLEALPMYQQGEIYLQSLSSMLPPLFLQPQPGENVLDMAAAPGGKTTQMCSPLRGQGHDYRLRKERHPRRAAEVQHPAPGRGPGCPCWCRTPAKLDDFFSFDKILLDAPCSGSGTLTVREGELVNKFSRELVDNSARLQEALLRKALRLLKPGHEMIYSTCSILQKENEDVLRRRWLPPGAKCCPWT